MADDNYSELAQRMWTSCIDNGIGGLLKPWQMRRLAHAHSDCNLILAKSERDASLILTGELELVQSADSSRRIVNRLDGRIEPELDLSQLPKMVTQQYVGEALRREVNVAKSLLHAEEQLQEDNSSAPDELVDGDWLRRWRDIVGEVSSESLQYIWGRLLAGEVKSPGTHSLRTMDIIRNLSSDDAQLISKLAPLSIHGFIAVDSDRNNDLTLVNAGISFPQFMYLEEIGILNGVTGGLTKSWSNNNGVDSYLALLEIKNLGLVLSHPDINAKASTDGFALTLAGRQIISLCDFEGSSDYLCAFGVRLKKNGFKAEICELEELGGGKVNLRSRREL